MAKADRSLLRTFARQFGVYLALAALTLQFALSFGHIHAHDIGYPGVAYSKASNSKTTASKASASKASASKASASKASILAGSLALAGQKLSNPFPSPLADDDANCPICFSALLLATSFIPDAPRHSPSLVATDVDRFSDRTRDLVIGADRAPFQSRAPPLC
ncbi:hypothetical protein [Bradyrhizobium sp.]|uniref:hypothetical protein n=1 Tax=Bradyrhizobium sp. TaxID=376 RepID=UPI003C347376